jgi:CTP:molybdopterin cytidylyltransferase MocA
VGAPGASATACITVPMTTVPLRVDGIVLAAGAGSRAGGPKALLRFGNAADGIADTWLSRSTGVLLEAGCERVVVVLGAMERLARPLVPDDPRIDLVVADDWELGLSASLRAGLGAVTGDAALITLVDLPDLPVSVVNRVARDATPATLRQAAFNGRPGHPVLIGRDHWKSAAASLTGDHGARAYLLAHGAEEVECADLWDGLDRDFG